MHISEELEFQSKQSAAFILSKNSYDSIVVANSNESFGTRLGIIIYKDLARSNNSRLKHQTKKKEEDTGKFSEI